MNTILKEQIKIFYESSAVLETRMKDLAKYLLYGGYDMTDAEENVNRAMKDVVN